jgi:diacylglycerol O-acyltransferase/trehalose O-mycolyltransferase
MGSRRDFVRAGVLTAGAVAVGGLGLRGAEASGLRVTQHKWLSHRLLDLTVYSPAMGRTVHNRLLVPPGWSATAKRTWPVLYLFHGGNDTYVSWTRSTDIEKFTANKDVLVVMPEGGLGGGYTDWWFGGKGGSPRWETYHLTELSGFLEQHYRASRTRAVVGLSAGGYGSLIYTARHPGFFKFTAAFSPFASTLMPGVPESMITELAYKGFNAFDMWGNPWSGQGVWKDHDPITQAPALRGTPLYVSCGITGLGGPFDPKGTGYGVGTTLEELAFYTVGGFLKRLDNLKIPVTRHLYQLGTHSWPYWQREFHTSWPLVAKALGV